MEEGETPEVAMVRELKEELGIEVLPETMENFWFLSHPYPEYGFHLLSRIYLSPVAG